MKDKGKRGETHTIVNALAVINVEVNNASVNENHIAPVVAKSLEVSDFFEDPDSHDKTLDWWMTAQT